MPTKIGGSQALNDSSSYRLFGAYRISRGRLVWVWVEENSLFCRPKSFRRAKSKRKLPNRCAETGQAEGSPE
ncbi:hypothetical protein RRG08_045021 [Elysia crispata]|uniref:Uncharacterized protein n=1 Tax=Elysia crispata TaxID=231223 RepID=A0AAE1CS59_9GAST|nr:hypothetical protein RRG08_045021 [Elysia crispata]